MTRTSPRTGTPTFTRRPLIALIAMTAAVVVWVVLVRVAGVDLDVTMSGRSQKVTLLAVIIASAISGLGAWLVVTLLERRVGNPRRAWITIGTVVLLVSLTGPLSLASTSVAALALACLHVVVALTLILGLTRAITCR